MNIIDKAKAFKRAVETAEQGQTVIIVADLQQRLDNIVELLAVIRASSSPTMRNSKYEWFFPPTGIIRFYLSNRLLGNKPDLVVTDYRADLTRCPCDRIIYTTL